MVFAANQDCKEDLHCKAAAVKFNPQLIADVSSALRRAYEQDGEVREFVKRELESRNEFSLDLSKKGPDLLVANWERSAVALDRIIDTYCEGAKPHHGEIDATTYDPESHTYLIDKARPCSFPIRSPQV